MANNSEDHPRRIGQYEVLGAIGRGAMGQVYKAVQPSLNRIVAVKVLPEEFMGDESRIERFNREAKAVAMLNHPNVVQIIDKDQTDENLFFVMEFVPGSSLDDVLQQRRLSLQEAFTVFRGVCHGLEAAHRQNIIHRDLNPRNILVSDDLTVVKLADFGISRVETISREMGTLSTAEAAMGTLHYMSPEQAQSIASVDHRTDIYSAGVVLYEMLTGRVPVGRFSLPSQLNSEVPSELDPICLKCLATEPEDRYPTVSHLLKAIGLLEDQLRLGLVNELKGISRSTSRIFKSSTKTLSGNRKMVIGGVAAAAALILAIGGFMLLGSDKTEAESQQAAATPLPGESAGDPAGAALQVQAAPRFEPEAVDDSFAVTLDELELPEGLDESASEAQPRPAAPAQAEPEVEEAPEPEPAQPAPAKPARPAGEDELKVALDKLEAGLYDPAIGDFEEFLDDFPNSSLVPVAYLAIAESHVGAGRVEEALASFVEVQSRFPNARQSAQAGYRQGELLMLSDRSNREQAAREIFTETATKFPNSSWAPKALMAKASIELSEKMEANDPVVGGRVPTALMTYRTVTELYGRTAVAEKAFERLAKLYDDEKRFDLAAAAWTQLGTNFPNNNAEAWWEAGQLFDKKLDDDERAIRAYTNVPQSSKHHDAAQKRINKLKR
jgi:serine/threonine protein kinase/outer membrane protein assembly factor BamD (BamD/ComL family)